MPVTGTHRDQMKTTLTRLLCFMSARFLLAGLICASPIVTQAKDEQAASAMAQAAGKLIASLDTDQKGTVAYAFGDKTRDVWHFFPNWAKRSGIPLSKLSKKQREPVMQMLSLLLTSDAFQEQENIRLIHGLKKDLNAPNNPRHLYFISIFGKPSVKSTWGWRFEGHHLSINCTLGGGKNFSVTPSFWGSSPIKVTKGERKGLEVFKKERALGLALVNSLSAKQKKLAGIERGNGPGATASVSRKAYQPQAGIPYSELNPAQQKQLSELVLVFAGKYRTRTGQANRRAQENPRHGFHELCLRCVIRRIRSSLQDPDQGVPDRIQQRERKPRPFGPPPPPPGVISTETSVAT